MYVQRIGLGLPNSTGFGVSRVIRIPSNLEPLQCIGDVLLGGRSTEGWGEDLYCGEQRLLASDVRKHIMFLPLDELSYSQFSPFVMLAKVFAWS